VRVAKGLADRGHPVRFVWSDEAVGERARAAGLAGACVRLGGDLDPRGIRGLRREMVRVGARAVLATRWREYLQGGLAARLAGRPRVVVGLGLLYTPPADLKHRLIFRLADRVLVNAPEIRDALVRHPSIPAAKVDVVVNGVDLPRWQPRWLPAARERGLAFRRSLGIAPDAPLLVNIGNLTQQKDQANLVAACDRLRGEAPGLHALVIGDGALRGELEADIRRRGLQDTVILAGFQADVAPALAAADLFVLSSENEGMAWVLMEAAACGLPTVTTDVSGARFCVEEGVTGLVVPPSDPGALARAVGELLHDGERRAAMGREARALAEARFDVERMLDETADVLFGAPAP
jgi:glycosyltransferase involved in cell wall biosynthesis